MHALSNSLSQHHPSIGSGINLNFCSIQHSAFFRLHFSGPCIIGLLAWATMKVTGWLVGWKVVNLQGRSWGERVVLRVQTHP